MDERDRRQPGALRGSRGAGQHPVEEHDIGPPAGELFAALAADADYERKETVAQQVHPSAEPAPP